MAATASTGEVYPDDIEQLLIKHSKYQDVGSISFAAYLISEAEITERNLDDFVKDLSKMKELYSQLVIMGNTSNMEIKTLSDRQMFFCVELAEKVPNIKEIPRYVDLTSNQKLMINSAVEQAEMRKNIATADPEIAKELKVLLGKIEPLELARILEMRLELAEELKENLSNDPQEPSQALEDLEATMDSQKTAQIIEDLEATMDSQKTAQIIEDQEATMDSQIIEK